VDASHEKFHEHIGVVQQTLTDLGVVDVPVMMVFNKMDAYYDKYFDKYLPDNVRQDLLDEFASSMRKTFHRSRCVFISATEKENIDELRNTLVLLVQDLYHKRYPYRSGFH
jgi:GTP-binding protein HflX